MIEIENLPTQQIRDKMEPINDFIFSHLTILIFVFALVLALYFLGRFRAYIFYRKYKGKTKETNKWFDWSAYNEHFRKYLQEKQQKENAQILARQERRAKNRYMSKKTANQNNG